MGSHCIDLSAGADPKALSDRSMPRRWWNDGDVRYLNTWAGVRPICVMCRDLQRSERALRCKLHKLGLSARVREGWSLHDLQTQFHLSRRTVLHALAHGQLKLHSGLITLPLTSPPPSVEHSVTAVDSDDRLCSCSIRDISARYHLSYPQICTKTLQAHWRLSKLRISDVSMQHFCDQGLLGPRMQWVRPALRRWLCTSTWAHVSIVPHRLPGHLNTLRTCPYCLRSVRGNAYFRHVAPDGCSGEKKRHSAPHALCRKEESRASHRPIRPAPPSRLRRTG